MENIKFFEEGGRHGWKRLNAEGGTVHVSALFATRESAEKDAETDVNGAHFDAGEGRGTPVEGEPKLEVNDSNTAKDVEVAPDEVPGATESPIPTVPEGSVQTGEPHEPQV